MKFLKLILSLIFIICVSTGIITFVADFLLIGEWDWMLLLIPFIAMIGFMLFVSLVVWVMIFLDGRDKNKGAKDAL